MAKVFISYASEDRNTAERIVAALKTANHSPLIDFERLHAGFHLTDKISDELRGADYVVLLVSKNAAGSDWVKWEFDFFNALGPTGLARRYRILPARLDEVEPVAEFPILAGLKYADFRHDFNGGMKELLGALKNAAEVNPEYTARWDLAVDLAMDAGARAMRFYNLSLAHSTARDKRDPAALAHKAAFQQIIPSIMSSKRYDQERDTIMCREPPWDGTQISSIGYSWVIDVLDGRDNFQNRVPFFCTAIAVLHKGEPVIAVVYDPVENRVFYALIGAQAQAWDIRHGEVAPLKSDSKVTEMKKALLGTHISSRPAVARRFFKERFWADLITDGNFVRTLGSAQLALAYVASGRIQMYFQLASPLWNHLAGVTLVQNSGGGIVRNLPPHEKFVPQKADLDIVACANQPLMDEFLARWRDYHRREGSEFFGNGQGT